jgi:hypothetical protein
MDKQEIEEKLKELSKEYHKAVGELNKQLVEIETAPENNVFDSVEDACGTLEERFLDAASLACEGSYAYGEDTYSQEFIVGDVHYIFNIIIEYSRHDKRYYYVDGSRTKVTDIFGNIVEV